MLRQPIRARSSDWATVAFGMLYASGTGCDTEGRPEPLDPAERSRNHPGHAHPTGAGGCRRLCGPVDIRHDRVGATDHGLRNRRLRCAGNVDRGCRWRAGAGGIDFVPAVGSQCEECQCEESTSYEGRPIAASAQKGCSAKKAKTGKVVGLRPSPDFRQANIIRHFILTATGTATRTRVKFE
jgi:hypothetical protein